MRLLILPIFAVSMLAGCATADTRSDAQQAQQEKEIVTGSNIPRRDRSGVAVASREALERMQNSSGGPTTRGSENLK